MEYCQRLDIFASKNHQNSISMYFQAMIFSNATYSPWMIFYFSLIYTTINQNKLKYPWKNNGVALNFNLKLLPHIIFALSHIYTETSKGHISGKDGPPSEKIIVVVSNYKLNKICQNKQIWRGSLMQIL